MVNNVFLDLEETVINNWDEGFLVHTSKVRDFLKEQNVKGWTVFSFAVWNASDVAVFQKRHQRFLEKALDCPVLSCPSCQDFMECDTEKTGVRFDSLTDFISIRGKVGAFTNWCAVNHSGQHSVLVDDVVPNAVWTNKDTNTTVEFVNVLQLT